MYLHKIEIQGFKSFANKTVLEFPRTSNSDIKAHSINGVVGPNGSGKSNIADAIRWVLGEQSPKLLRGKKADDVIFAGSSSKARLGLAEVSLYLNNEDKSAPIDYTEIVITRRVFRDGEGEYLINRSRVRLFDILMLLAKANFGQKSYSIIGQGMVDHIINISPWERKEFFDEATGVKQYQIKRDQAVSRLTRSRENLGQTNQILAELEPRLRLLTRQIKKLEKRKVLEKELRTIQEKYYAHSWQTLKREKLQHREQGAIKTALKTDWETRLAQTQIELAELARAESRKNIFNDLQKQYNKLMAQKNEVLKELAALQGKMSLEYVKAGKQNLSWLEDQQSQIQARLSEIQDSLANAETTLVQQRELLIEQEKKSAAINRELAVMQNNYQVAQADYAQSKSGRPDGNQAAVQAVLSRQAVIKGIHGTIGQLGQADELYQLALAAAAGAGLRAVVVENDETAVKCIDFLKQNKLGTVTFLPLNKLKVRELNHAARNLLIENGAIGLAVDLIAFDAKFAPAFKYVFGSTIIMDNIDNARGLIGRERLVTLDGDLLEKSGAMRGGYRSKNQARSLFNHSDKQSASPADRLQALAVMQSKIQERQQQKELCAQTIADLKVNIQVADTKIKGLANDSADRQKELARLQAELSEQSIAPQDQAQYLKNLTERREQAEKAAAVIEQEIQKIKKKIDSFNLDEEKKKMQVFSLQETMQEQQRKLNEVNDEVNAINITLARLDAKQEDLEKEAAQELGANVKMDKLRCDVMVNNEQVWLEIAKLKKNLELIGGIDPEIIDEHKEVSERYEFLSAQVLDLEKGIKDLDKIAAELDVVIKKQFNSSFKKINESFEHYFKQIFEGGKAKLTILQKQDPKQQKLQLETADGRLLDDDSQPEIEPEPEFAKTGVDIYVSPPNKKLNIISALSGGERTMTSLALLCAIIDCNPSPFVVMDEVDAALDEANSERFARILQELSYKTQFVVITHNRVIMHVADVLYGVAMGMDGVSKTLSLDLKQAEKIKDK